MEKAKPEFKIGIIGFGEMGKRHALEYSEATLGKLDFTAVVEPEEKRYEEGCRWYGKTPRRYTEIEKMLAREDLDGLIISSPNHSHLENLKKCAGSNLPVLLEKPLESTLEKIFDLVKTARSFKKPVLVDHVMRYAPIIRKAGEIISSGGIGKVCSFNFVQYSGGGPLFSTFRRTKSGGGGHLIEKATHDLDAAFYLCGAAPRAVYGISRLQKYGGDAPDDLTCSKCGDISCSSRAASKFSVPSGEMDIEQSSDLCAFSEAVDVFDNETCLVECTGGVFGVYSHCFFVRNHFSRRYEIIGTGGILYIELSVSDKSAGCDGRITLTRGNSLSPLPGREEYKFYYGGKIHYNGGAFAGRHFYDVILGKSRPFTTVEEAFAAEMTGIAAMKSSEEKRRLDILKDIVPEELREAYEEAYTRAPGSVSEE